LYKKEFPPPLKEGRSDKQIREFVTLYEDLRERLSAITAKKIGNFRQNKQPTKTEKSVGLAYLLLFSALDSAIRLTHDKSTLVDKSWEPGVTQYFANVGKVMQNLKKLKDILDYGRVPEGHLA